jgi:hypothetical protein
MAAKRPGLGTVTPARSTNAVTVDLLHMAGPGAGLLISPDAGYQCNRQW